MRRKYTGTVRNKYGKIMENALISVYLADTTTPANIYATWNGATHAHSMLSDSNGRYTLYVDTFDYNDDQTFKIICAKGSLTLTVDNITIEDVVLDEYTISVDKTVTTGVKVPQGVTYNVATGKTLTFSGSFDAGLYQVFTGAGAVKFENVKAVPAIWFGTGAAAETKARAAIFGMTWPVIYTPVYIIYGSGDPPLASTVPDGTLYLKYTAT
jgi:hypothetical protein